MTAEESAEHLFHPRPPAISEEEIKVRAWIEKFRGILVGHSIDAILFFAKLNDLDPGAVKSVLSDFDIIMSGRTPEGVLALHAHQFEKAVERVGKMRAALESSKYLVDLWKDLTANTVTGEPIELKEPKS